MDERKGMQKIQLDIVALVKSDVHPNSYVIVLKEMNGDRRLPIIIGGFEARAIVMALESVDANRPLTHDLIKNTLQEFHINLKEVVISELKEGVFFSMLLCANEDGSMMGIDSRTSDAIALAVRFDANIFVHENIMEEAGILLEANEDDDDDDSIDHEDVDQLEDLDDDQLSKMLEGAIQEEDYELAARIRDEQKKRHTP